MTTTPGYSGTPLAQKLGLKDGQRVLFIALPPELTELRTARQFVEVAEAGWETFQSSSPDRGYDLVHGFTAPSGCRGPRRPARCPPTSPKM